MNITGCINQAIREIVYTYAGFLFVLSQPFFNVSYSEASSMSYWIYFCFQMHSLRTAINSKGFSSTEVNLTSVGGENTDASHSLLEKTLRSGTTRVYFTDFPE